MVGGGREGEGGGGGSVLPVSRWLDSLRREVGSQPVPQTQPPLQRCNSTLAWKEEKWADSFQRTPIIPGASLAPCLQPPAGTHGSASDLQHILKNQHLAGEECSLTANSMMSQRADFQRSEDEEEEEGEPWFG